MQTSTASNYEANQSLLMRSRIEADTLKERDIRCPACGFRVQTVFSDITGHLKIKCPKCKGLFVINVAYFRKQKSRQCNRWVHLGRYYK